MSQSCCVLWVPQGRLSRHRSRDQDDLGNGWAGRQPPANALCSSGTDAAGEPMRKQARDSSSRCMGARNEGSRQACNQHVCRARAGCSPPSRCTQGCCMLIASWRGWCCWPAAWAAAPLHQREGAHKVMGGSGHMEPRDSHCASCSPAACLRHMPAHSAHLTLGHARRDRRKGGTGSPA